MLLSRSHVGAITIGVLFGLGGVLAYTGVSSSQTRPAEADDAKEGIAPDVVLPPTKDVTMTIDGRSVLIPETLLEEVNLQGSRALGEIKSEYVFSGASRSSGYPCFLMVPKVASPDAPLTLGCDPIDDVEKKGGWLITRPDVGGTQAALLILPTHKGATTFTAREFARVVAGTRLTVTRILGK